MRSLSIKEFHMKNWLHYKSALLLSIAFFSSFSWAWGKRGHALICETAAYLALSDEKPGEFPHFLKVHSFDLGYYCNVPDIIWKRPATYSKESPNHFMDLEIFDRQISKKSKSEEASIYRISRLDFEKSHKDIPEKMGRSWWRIQELEKELESLSQKLKDKELGREKHQDLQAKWLLYAGAMGHYIGDLAMPLHVSENYDGQLTNQKGIHHYFEESLVDELYLDKRFGLQELVYKKAFKLWFSYKKKAKGKDLLTLVQELSRDSQKKVEPLLKRDKETGRKNLVKASKLFKDLIVERLAQGVLLQAYLLKSHLGWDYNGKKFYQFLENPSYIEPPKGALPKK